MTDEWKRGGASIRWNATQPSKRKMPLAVTWVNLEIIIRSDVSHKEKRQVPHDISYMWSLKYNTKEQICKAEKVSQIQSTDLWLPALGVGRGMDWN